MLRPQINTYRDALDLSGVWRCQSDPGAIGERDNWIAGLPAPLAIAIPGSWNEQLSEQGLMNYLGAVWFEQDIFIPDWMHGRQIELYFGSADYRASVWANGQHVGESGPPLLPFSIDIGSAVTAGKTAKLLVRVDNQLRHDDMTPAVTKADYISEARAKDEYLPAVRFDFFPYGGLNRPVKLVARPKGGLEAVRINTELNGTAADISFQVKTGAVTAQVRVRLSDEIRVWTAQASAHEEHATLDLDIHEARLWSPSDPFLHTLEVEALDPDGVVIDAYQLPIGIRDVRVEGATLLLNGAPVELKGFGKHEEGPIRGRGLDQPQIIKDFELMAWCGANSFRTSHYPYSEEWLDEADRRGILVISELFSVNLDFRRVSAETLSQHKTALAAQIARDANHPCVIAWSLANEPGYLNEPEARSDEAATYWRDLYATARHLDPTRPLTHANVEYLGLDDPAFAEDDFICLNRYHGWYRDPGQIETATEKLKSELDSLATRFGKPILISEFGADALPGAHATTDQMWTEEYQADLIAAYWRVVTEHPSAIGAHVWNFADFRTAQHGRRAVLNCKGVFTRTRDPKRAAFVLRDLWAEEPNARHQKKTQGEIGCLDCL
ncbi:MAG: glycoside hydrolase family 2 TIM barrel-domain containing protein [Henriciella sp.]|nr:glycoside hydrolase family 2 TIM barrel-domain containing protein [Henriciella sp.]